MLREANFYRKRLLGLNYDTAFCYIRTLVDAIGFLGLNLLNEARFDKDALF
jgi:hypothetical protein